MSDLLWPGDERAGDLFTDAAVCAAMVRVEAAWLAALVLHGVAAPDARDDLDGLIGPGDVATVAAGAESGGNPLIPLLKLLRKRLEARNPAAASWLHRGLTSQDVVDTGLVLCLRDAADRIGDDLAAQAAVLARLAEEHRDTPMAGRTLTQHAVPITFGLKAAGWLTGVLDARDRLAAVSDLPLQVGGAAGSLAAPVALAGSPAVVGDLVETTAETLGLPVRDPWHTARAPLTGLADAFVTCTDAWGRIANDVLVSARPEIHELSEGAVAGRGGSSAMPNKQNPVLSVLVKRAALAAPFLAATVHAGAAAAVDERPDGGWHVEWATLRTLARRTVTAGSQTAELLAGLQVETAWMTANLTAARPGIDAEQRSINPGAASGEPYPGATDRIIDAAIARAKEHR
ncbi:3-carboxy-cis,cis-muconate cycloisomerase [Actinoplanes campanulatus]|uniref:3-carboxy-cis,cis-muconate cycloisomerase n=1 Tax=Actinoplanes campanulatus TaxID=113559 RepID=A0A7W5AG28_9ACTN|nr:lyase family protein [Actinoplanes campanulatus]MBB3095405.1 3-carboxy-cis,cis-muconate cycloisomerase [Actinoplanes campanulatus]GGN41937.1 3-carboxy-cis,cis-muconate cycloisomerase [Actinoplanes campanulatus]GID35009.1 3-carboxy-cis,cis-muconate cycloisomerase [Actinoplanes campanulatus]